MNITELFNSFSGQNFIDFFFKAFALLFSFIFVIYAIVVAKQTQVMNQTLKGPHAGIISLISLIQIFVAVGLLLLAIFLI